MRGPNIFTTATAMCEHPDSDYLFVFDAGIGTYGTLHKVAKSSLEVSESYPIGGWHSTGTGLMSSAVISDMIVTDVGTGNHMWFAAYRTARVTSQLPHTDKFLFYFAAGSLASGSSFVPTSKQFDVQPDSNPNTADTGQYIGDPSITLFKRSLSRWKNDESESVMFLFNNNGTLIKTPNSTHAPYVMAVILDKDAVAVSYLNLNSTNRAVYFSDYDDGAAFLNRNCTGLYTWVHATDDDERMFGSFQAGTNGVNTVFAVIPFLLRVSSKFLEIVIKFFSLLALFNESLSTISLRGSGFNTEKDKSSSSSRIRFIPMRSANGAYISIGSFALLNLFSESGTEFKVLMLCNLSANLTSSTLISLDVAKINFLKFSALELEIALPSN